MPVVQVRCAFSERLVSDEVHVPMVGCANSASGEVCQWWGVPIVPQVRCVDGYVCLN